MDQNLVIRMAFAAVGVFLILFAIMMRQLLSERHVVDLIADKLGLTLKVDAFGLIVLVGFVMIGSQIVLWYKGYEDKLSNLQQEVGGLKASLAEFKEHELKLTLSFVGSDDPNPSTLKWPPNAYVHKVGEREPKLYPDFDSG